MNMLTPQDLLPPQPADIRPMHYGGQDDTYEVFKVIDAWGVGFYLGNALKYICRAGKKDPSKEVEDLVKARTYINARLERLGHRRAL